MKRIAIVSFSLAMMLLNSNAYVVYLNADFENSGLSAEAFADALTAGTALGNWRFNIEGSSSYATNGAVRLDTSSDGYDYIAELDSLADCSNETVTLSYDVRNIRSAASPGGKSSRMIVRDEEFQVMVDLRLSSSDGTTYLDIAEPGTNDNYITLSTALFEAYGTASLPPSDFNSIELVMNSNGVNVYLDDVLLTNDFPYLSPVEPVSTLRLRGMGTAQSGAWYDNMLVMTDNGESVTTNFFSDFENIPTLTLVDYLNDGTSTGSWIADNLQESEMVQSSDDNMLVTFDQGVYDFTLTPIDNTPLRTGTEFSIDFRNRRGGATKPSVIAFYDENSDILAGIRFRSNWNGNGLEELQISTNVLLIAENGLDEGWVTVSTNLLAVGDANTTAPTTNEMQTLSVLFADSGYDVVLENETVCTEIPYFSSSAEISAVRFFSPAAYGGIWYDNIHLGRETLSSIQSFGLEKMFSEDFRISWVAEAVGIYSVQERSSLTTGVWTDVQSDIIGIDGTLSITTTPATAIGFYRIIGR